MKPGIDLKFFLVLLISVLFVFFTLIYHYLISLFLGWMLAELIRPLHLKLLGKKTKKTWTAAFSMAVVTGAVILPLGVFSFLSIQSLVRAFKSWPIQQELLNREFLLAKIESLPWSRQLFEHQDVLVEHLQGVGQSVLTAVTRFISTQLGNTPDVLMQVVFALLTCFFILVDGDRFLNWIGPKIPLKENQKKYLSSTLSKTVVSSFWATVLAASVQSILIWIGFLILSIPMKTLALGMAFLFSWIPIVGTTPVWIVGTIYLASHGRMGAASVMVLIGILASLSDNIVRPLALQGGTPVHPLANLLILIGAIQYFGLIGIFLGPVIISLLVAMIELWPGTVKEIE